MSVSHEYSTMDEIKYDDRGYVEKTKKKKQIIWNPAVKQGDNQATHVSA